MSVTKKTGGTDTLELAESYKANKSYDDIWTSTGSWWLVYKKVCSRTKESIILNRWDK